MVLDALVRFYNYVIYDIADERVKGQWFFVDSPINLVLLLIAYNVFVLKIGQDWMRNRPAFNLKKVILAFDFIQIIINVYMVFLGIKLGWFWNLPFFCYEIDERVNDFTAEVIYGCYLYYIIKLSDLIDTVFFVLRKRFSHVTFLHVYHHTGMVLLSWGAVKYIPGGHHTLIGVINCFVHAIMYTYYLVTTIYPQRKLFKVKKFVTQIQMYQFLVAFIHMTFVAIVPGCNYPKFVLFILLPNNLMIFLLFFDFYQKTYVRRQNQTEHSSDRQKINKTT